MATVLIPLPDRDFDTTEVAVPWKLLKESGHDVVFATERGDRKPECDQLLLTGVLFGKLGAEEEPKKFYDEMLRSPEIEKPIPWGGLLTMGAAPPNPRERLSPLRFASRSSIEAFDALLLPGGHASGMRQYLGSEDVHVLIAAFFATGKPVAAICHGVLPIARAKSNDGKSPLFGKKTTCLPKYMERAAYMMTAWKLGRYYRTYDAYVEDEVRAALAQESDFVRGPRTLTERGTMNDDAPAMVVEDGAYISARWPGDAYLFAKTLIAKL